MDQEDMTNTQQPAESGSGAEEVARLEATRGLNLGGLLGGLLSSQQSEGATPGTPAPESGLSASALQAILPLIVGALLGQGGGRAADETKAALTDLAAGKAGAADVLSGAGLLKEIMKRTGLDKKGALGVITAVLKALGVGKTTASSKPKPKPKPAAKPKPKPKPSATAKPKPKPKSKPKPSSSSTSSKPKPKAKPKTKPSASAKPKSKPKARRTGEVSE